MVVRIATARPFQETAAAARLVFRAQSHSSVVVQPLRCVDMKPFPYCGIPSRHRLHGTRIRPDESTADANAQELIALDTQVVLQPEPPVRHLTRIPDAPCVGTMTTVRFGPTARSSGPTNAAFGCGGPR
jgi:hypothetical protein